MLEIRLNCENCDKLLPNYSREAMICTFECTYCRNCVEEILKNVCPNCGGGFEKRPVRPKNLLGKYHTRKDKVLKPVKENKYLKEFIDIEPSER